MAAQGRKHPVDAIAQESSHDHPGRRTVRRRPSPVPRQPQPSERLFRQTHNKAPSKSDVEGWAIMRALYEHGFNFHSCGCGVGFKPPHTLRAKVPKWIEQ